MAKKSKKSRFGNPAKASADAAGRAGAKSAADARLDRAMTALASGFADWLADQGESDASIDMSMTILDDFFDMYRILEPKTDPTQLVPEAVEEIMTAASHANRLAAMGLRSGVRRYVDYLAHANLWTGTSSELLIVLDTLALAADGDDLYDGADYDDFTAEDMDFAEIFIPEVSDEEARTAVDNSPLWQNTLALLAWIGEGKELTEDGVLPEQESAAATLTATAIGQMSTAAKFTTPRDHGAARLALYLELLDAAGLISMGETTIRVSPNTPSLESDKLEIMRDLMGHFIFLMTLEGSQEGIYDDWHLEMASWLTQAASNEPPEAEDLVKSLTEPETAHPDLLAIAQNIAQWTEEGLVTIGEFVEVPPAWRADVYDLLQGDFPIVAAGPGAPAM